MANILYAEMAFLCCIVLIFLLWRTLKNAEKSQTTDAFVELLIFSIIFTAVDSIWGVFASHTLIWGKAGYEISTYGFHAMSATASFFWVRFTIQALPMKKNNRNIFLIAAALLLIAQYVILFTNIFTNKVFTISEVTDPNGPFYTTYKLRSYLFYLQFTNYIMIALYATIRFIVDKNSREYHVKNVIIYSIVALITGLFQLLATDMPMYSCGFMLSCLTIFVYTITQEQSDILKMKRDLEIEQNANEAKTNFLSSMSHDIRTPMNAIVGLVEITKQNTTDSARVEENLNKISMASYQLLSLINDVLDISAIESGKLTLRPSKYDVIAGFKQFQDLFNTQIIAKSIIAKYDCHDIKYQFLNIDIVRLNQIFVNIMSNAIKYTQEGGHIFVEYYEEEKDGRCYLVGIIRDTGIGMSDDFMQKMWDTFSRATDTRINKIQGTGLGLSIVKRLIDLMDGTIEVQSKLNVGSTFKASLPVTPIEIKKAEEEEEEEEEGAKKFSTSMNLNLNVIIAEDNDMNYEITQELFSLRGIKTVRAINGEKCVELFVNSSPKTYDMIFMDMQMPIMNGVEATKAIRASNHPEAKTIPIFAMTANAFREDIEECQNAGMNEHLSKPIDIQKVIQTIQKYI